MRDSIGCEMSSRGRFATLAAFLLQECSPCTEGYTHAAK
jgi:hypothetical protein